MVDITTDFSSGTRRSNFAAHVEGDTLSVYSSVFVIGVYHNLFCGSGTLVKFQASRYAILWYLVHRCITLTWPDIPRDKGPGVAR